ncbi:MAG: DUF2461 domain-containing protein [Tepidisphaeraceae bacterium]
MASAFPGFPKQALTFLRQLKAHNDRDWFNAHKDQFKTHLHEPMLALIERLREKMLSFAAEHTFEPKRAIYRIYRDTRFSKDKTPYKDHYGAQFQHPKVTKNLGAGYYFHISPTEVAIGGGFYMPGPDELLALRLAMVRDEKRFRALLADKKVGMLCGSIQGESAARVPKMLESAPANCHDLVKRKQAYFYVELDPKVATTPTLEKELVSRFEKMAPLIDWANDAIIAALVKSSGGEDKPKRPAPMF